MKPSRFSSIPTGQKNGSTRAKLPSGRSLKNQAEDFPLGMVPVGGLFLTCSVDIQGDRIEVEVRAWGRMRESWSIAYEVIQPAKFICDCGGFRTSGKCTKHAGKIGGAWSAGRMNRSRGAILKRFWLSSGRVSVEDSCRSG